MTARGEEVCKRGAGRDLEDAARLENEDAMETLREAKNESKRLDEEFKLERDRQGTTSKQLEELEPTRRERGRVERERRAVYERVEILEKQRDQSESRYREVTKDYEKIADEKVEWKKKFDKISEEKDITSEVLQSVQADNEKMKKEIARLSAPKFATPKSQKPLRSQPADATSLTPRAASSAASSASSRASSEAGIRKSSESANISKMVSQLRRMPRTATFFET